MQEIVNTIGLKLLSLEGPACKDGPRQMCENLTSETSSNGYRCFTVARLFVHCDLW